MYIKYVFGRDWPSKSAGTSFTIFSSYGIAKSDASNHVEILMKKNTRKENYNNILKKEFELSQLKNFKVKFLDQKYSIIDKTTSFYIKAYKYLKKCAKKDKLDVVITRKVGFLPYLYFLKKKFNIKIIYEAHDYYLENPPERKKHFKKKLFQKLFLPKFDGIITHMETMKKLYKKHIPNQNYLLARTGIQKIFNDNLEKKKVISYIGSLGKRKKIIDIFEAMNIINDKEIKFLIIGGKNKNEINYYYDLAEEYNLKSQVNITGWVTRKEVDELLADVSIGVVPLEDTFFNRYLTSPMKIFNYFSHGIPVIGSDLPSIREIISNRYGLLYEKDDYNDLAKKVQTLFKNQYIYNKYRENIFNFDKELLWGERGKKILNFIECI